MNKERYTYKGWVKKPSIKLHRSFAKLNSNLNYNFNLSWDGYIIYFDNVKSKFDLLIE